MIKTYFERIWLALFAHPSFSRFNHYMMNLFQKNIGINNYKSDNISGETFWANYIMENYSVDLIFDIGAHKGDYANMFRSAGYLGEIYMFEPNPETYEELVNRTNTSNHNYHFNIGFSDVKGFRLIFDYDIKGGSPHASLFSKVITDMHNSENTKSLEVNLMTLDEFTDEHKINKISFLKIDTEGNEFPILKGAKKLLRDDKIDLIQFEFGEMNVISGFFFKDFFDLLSEKYLLYRLLPNALLPLNNYNARNCEIFIYQNIIAVHKNLMK
ncbi:MAG: FkbM family methyltransferase [Lewinellaceae bacterium]|nr:FkbM family methyltransferase [Lewinellaceae bacterium]